MRNKKFSILFAGVFLLAVAMSAQAIKFAGEAYYEATVEPNATPWLSTENFDISGELLVWIDSRYPDYVSRIYCTLLNDPCRTECLLDVDASGTWIIRADGSTVVYSVRDAQTEEEKLRVIEINDVNNPCEPNGLTIEDINTVGHYIYDMDFDGGVIAYVKEYDWYTSEPEQIYALNLADPNRNNQYLIYQFDNENTWRSSNIALDGRYLSWSGYTYDPCSGWSLPYLAVADINDLNDPNISITIIPCSNPQISVETSVEQLDTSGDWLIATGRCKGTKGVFGIHNYKDPNSFNWQFAMLYAIGSSEYGISTPQIDDPFAVWVVNSYGASQYSEDLNKQQTGGSTSETSNMLMGAVMLDNGKAAISVLRVPGPNETMYGVNISGNDIVFSQETYGYEGEEYWYLDDLFSAELEIECGDWGYSLADLNHDCKVDFKDLAIFAQRWLDCTVPNDDSCIYGQVWPAGNNLFEIDI